MSERFIPIAPAKPAAIDAAPPLTTAQRATLRAAAALVIPASAEFGVPGADDEIIAADITADLEAALENFGAIAEDVKK